MLERVKYIHSRLSMNLDHDNSVKGLDSGTIPIQYGGAIEFGNYFVLYLSFVLDTSSDLTWIQCQPCTSSCLDQQDEIFYPMKSSSYSNITCTSSACSSSTKGCMCIHYYIYEDQFYSIGYFSHEQLTVTTTNIMDNFLFGCSQGNKGCSGGVMGLGRHPISFVQQTSSKYKKIFSYCLPSRSNRVCVRRQCHSRDCRNWGSLCDEGQEGFV
ncbi:Aspartyl protease family protein [Glycine soja]